MNTETNPRLEAFQSFIGQDMSNSPSPLGRFLNGRLINIEMGSLTVEFTVRETLTNPMGTLHGGVAAAMMDDIVGIMVFAMGRDYAYTSVNLNCDFLSAARIGDVLTANTYVVRAGRNVIHCEAKITNNEGKIIAKCSTNMIQTGVKITF
jgi:acyl-coenzyme A thioesterase 13